MGLIQYETYTLKPTKYHNDATGEDSDQTGPNLVVFSMGYLVSCRCRNRTCFFRTLSSATQRESVKMRPLAIFPSGTGKY